MVVVNLLECRIIFFLEASSAYLIGGRVLSGYGNNDEDDDITDVRSPLEFYIVATFPDSSRISLIDAAQVQDGELTLILGLTNLLYKKNDWNYSKSMSLLRNFLTENN